MNATNMNEITNTINVIYFYSSFIQADFQAVCLIPSNAYFLQSKNE